MKLIHYLLAFSTIAFAACNNCGGVNETVYNYAMTIENTGDTIKTINGRYNDELRLTTLSRSEKGDRKCRYKTYVFNFGETIDSNSVTVYCNHDISVKSTVVKSGENLKKRPDLFEYWSGRIRISLNDTSIAGTTNTYYVKGSTSKGSNFLDSVSVYYQ